MVLVDEAVTEVVDGALVVAVAAATTVVDVRDGPVLLDEVVVVVFELALPQDAVVTTINPMPAIRRHVPLMETVCAHQAPSPKGAPLV